MKGPLLCPQCRRLISRDESACPHCGLRRPASRWRQLVGMRWIQQPETVIRAIIFCNIGMYVLSLLFNPMASNLSINPLMFLSPSSGSLILLGATGANPDLIFAFPALLELMNGPTALAPDLYPRWWTLLSANYLHGGVLHIFFNMMVFKQLAPFVIREFGTHRMIGIYTVGGVAGFLASYWADVSLTIGASAAVFGLIGAILYYAKSRGGTYGQALFRQVGGWAAALLLIGFLVPVINNWGHGGGLLGGMLAGLLLGYQEKRPESFSHKLFAAVCIGATVVVLGWAVFSGLYYRIMV